MILDTTLRKITPSIVSEHGHEREKNGDAFESEINARTVSQPGCFVMLLVQSHLFSGECKKPGFKQEMASFQKLL